MAQNVRQIYRDKPAWQNHRPSVVLNPIIGQVSKRTGKRWSLMRLLVSTNNRLDTPGLATPGLASGGKEGVVWGPASSVLLFGLARRISARARGKSHLHAIIDTQELTNC